ncbi:hypothetical protein ACWD3J_45460 [Streptomyces sp. NPDC002755]|uniref:hypothetical protein n=1 Tax=Streptomyces sp. NPDC002884 TaxID=3154544 RepID=UPI00332EB6A0
MPPLSGATASSHAGFLVRLAVPDVDSFHAFVVERLVEGPEVADARTAMVHGHVRTRRIEPPGPTGPDRPRSATRAPCRGRRLRAAPAVTRGEGGGQSAARGLDTHL